MLSTSLRGARRPGLAAPLQGGVVIGRNGLGELKTVGRPRWPEPVEGPQGQAPSRPGLLRASVIVRARNMAPSIVAALRSLRDQTVEVEVVLVDSGSTDATVALARPYCDKVVHIAPESFSYGRALNVGAAEGSGDICFALSAHRVAPGTHWVEHSLEAYADPRVVATMGETTGPDGRPLEGPVTYRLPLPALAANLSWGLSNTASSWRRTSWESEPFNEALGACEDKEWMWRVLERGWAVVADPRLHVDAEHRRKAGLVALYRRVRAEHQALAELVGYPVPGLAELMRDWVSDFPYASHWPSWTRVLSPYRGAELLGGFVGDRAGGARRGPGALPLEFFAREPARGA